MYIAFSGILSQGTPGEFMAFLSLPLPCLLFTQFLCDNLYALSLYLLLLVGPYVHTHAEYISTCEACHKQCGFVWAKISLCNPVRSELPFHEKKLNYCTRLQLLLYN